MRLACRNTPGKWDVSTVENYRSKWTTEKTFRDSERSHRSGCNNEGESKRLRSKLPLLEELVLPNAVEIALIRKEGVNAVTLMFRTRFFSLVVVDHRLLVLCLLSGLIRVLLVKGLLCAKTYISVLLLALREVSWSIL